MRRMRASPTLSDDVAEVLLPWMRRQRWYSGKGHAPRARPVGSWDLSGDGDAVLRTSLLRDEAAARPVLYQVPFTVREEPLDDDGSAALIGTVGGGVTRRRFLYDGPRDPAFAGALLESILRGEELTGSGARAHGSPSRPLRPVATRSHALSGEQSNTSIVYEPAQPGGPDEAADPPEPFPRVICKVFRTLHPGGNPDVELESALAAAGSRRVPDAIGSLSAEWPEPGRRGGRAGGHAAFAQEFVDGSEDGWSLALREARAGRDFRERAASLGEATAEVHEQLADLFGSRPPHPRLVEGVLAGWRRRLEIAVAEVPGVEELREAVRELYAAAAEGPWPAFQRIHGDLHLGQALAAPDGRWLLIDFEGEPLRPLSERSLPDVAARDVAGMLRSLDYAAASLPDVAGAPDWAEESRLAFLGGYVAARPAGGGFARLLDAFETDKAVYEAVYEARNRPGWLPIPLAALRRLAERAR